MNIDKISDDWLMILTAMVKDCSHMVECPNADKKRREYALPLRQARKTRSLKKISVFDHLEEKTGIIYYGGRKPPKPLPEGFSLSEMEDDEVKIWFAIGAEIVDFSTLGRGVRPYVEAVYLESQKELKKRNIEADFFCDLKM